MKLLLVLLLLSCVAESGRVPCAERRVGENQLLCVCNSTYCDTIETTEDLSPSHAVLYVTTRDGLRMERQRVQKTLRRRSDSVVVKVDTTSPQQEIIGFGGAFTDAACLNIHSLSNATAERLMKTYYSEEGALYSMGRIPIASTDFSLSIYSYDDHPGDTTLSNFSLHVMDTMYKIPTVQRALQLSNGSLRLFASPWSAPAWMKSSGKMEGPGYLKTEYMNTWAKYFLRFIESYASWGIRLWGVTVQNEPTSGIVPFYKWQTMYWSAAGMREFVKEHLGPVLAAEEVSKYTKIIGLDDDRFRLPSYASTLYEDPEASKYFAGVGVHWYYDGYFSSDRLSETHALDKSKFILATEACAGFSWPTKGVRLGDWERAERYASNIIDDVNHFVGGWVDWNVALDMNGGPTWAKNFVDAPIVVDKAKDEFYKQPMFYAIAHFSRFVRPGARRVLSSSSSSHVEAAAFTHSQGLRVAVLLNRAATVESVSVEDSNGSVIPLDLPPFSITTLLWRKA